MFLKKDMILFRQKLYSYNSSFDLCLIDLIVGNAQKPDGRP